MDTAVTVYVQHLALPNTLLNWLKTLTDHQQNYECSIFNEIFFNTSYLQFCIN